jgi:transcriptional regulator with XRE-family HTH domain
MKSWFGSNLLILRSRLGISQEEMANRLNIRRPAYSCYENYKADATYDTLLRICEYFNISVDTILKYDLSGIMEYDGFNKLRIDFLRKNIAINRLIAGHTQEYVAQKIGVERNTYCNWEVGRSNPGYLNLINIANFYQKDLDHFFKQLQINECD